jgi:hypothetical protein
MEISFAYWLEWKLNTPFEAWPKNEEKVSKVRSAKGEKTITA